MEQFNFVKKGYDPQQVDEYVATLNQVIKSYKDKDNAIKNAIISAQIAADNITKNAHLEIAEYKSHATAHLRRVYEALEGQKTRIQSFQHDYNAMVRKYLNAFDESDLAEIFERIEELERYINELQAVQLESEKSERPLFAD